MSSKKTIHLWTEAKSLKPLIILENLFYNSRIFHEHNIMVFTDASDGIVVEFCRKHDIKCERLPEESLDISIKYIIESKHDMLVSLGWGKYIHPRILECYEYCLNCHGGILPFYKGARVYMASYANIADEYGVTIHYMNEKFDDGAIIRQVKIKLFLEETPEIMHRRLCELTAIVLPGAIDLVFAGYQGEAQVGESRYYYKLTREEMDSIRHENIERIRSGREKITAPYK
jgi:phosphoribosylglycinamide formyltransferase-1